MKSVGVKDLKDGLSRYLRLVRAGARFLVTDHGRPVAELGPAETGEEGQEAALSLAAAKGQVTLPRRRPSSRHAPVRLRRGAKLSDAVIEDRR